MHALIFAVLLAIADDPHQHHQHGAPDLGNIGKAHLATSCSEAAQKEIDRGVTLIHSFWYAEAEKSFRRAAGADETCGMAWWGVAMSNLHPLWAPPTPEEKKTGVDAVERAIAAGAKTDRELAFIDAIATYFAGTDHRKAMLEYEQKMDALERKQPKDNEVAIFHALALIGIADPKDKTYASQKKAAAILNRVLPDDPEHPGVAHYLIHSFDYPELAELALPAARVYAKLAPGSPHALHMPSHIFTRLGLWDESIASNLASAEKARNYVAEVMPGATAFDELHAVDYLVYAYLQQGRIDDAKKLVDAVSRVTKVDQPSQFAAAHAMSAVPARFALERRQWKEATALQLPSVIEWQKVPYAEANIHFARAIGGARSGDLVTARAAVERLAAIQKSLTGYWADQVEIQRLAGAAWLARGEKKDEEALKLMRAAADLEDSTEKHPVTPGKIIPAREQFAEMLLETGDAKDAVVELKRVLHDAPGRRSAQELEKRANAN
jgi:hypothetical protein